MHAHAVITPPRTLAQHCKRLSPLIAAPAALLLSQGQAKAVLTYNIFESAGNVVIQTSGSLNLTGAVLNETKSCDYAAGRITSAIEVLCTGPGNEVDVYRISGPTSFNGTVSTFPASSVSGITTGFSGNVDILIGPDYISGTPIVSSATFNGTTLASLGFTTSGLIGTWSLTGTSETIQVFLGNPPSAAVPGPLPLLGIGAAFSWSRRLRKRIATPLITPPQA